MITQKRLKELLCYNSDTGIFTWRIGFRNHVNAGSIAGSKMGKEGNYYISINVDGKPYLAHRLAYLYMTGSFPPYEIDHKYGDGLDNKWEGIRASTRSQNCENRKLFKNNKTGITGVSVYVDRRGKIEKSSYVANININNKMTHLYKGSDLFEACCRRKSAEIETGYTNYQQ